MSLDASDKQWIAVVAREEARKTAMSIALASRPIIITKPRSHPLMTGGSFGCALVITMDTARSIVFLDGFTPLLAACTVLAWALVAWWCAR